MAFWRQLYFLLWKNIRLKWRRKLLTVIEVSLPMLLFLVLILLSYFGGFTSIFSCDYNSEVAMPSAGFIPFFQSVKCSNKDACLKYPNPDADTGILADEKASLLSRSLNVLEEVYKEADLFGEAMTRTGKVFRSAQMNSTNKTEIDSLMDTIKALKIPDKIAKLGLLGPIDDAECWGSELNCFMCPSDRKWRDKLRFHIDKRRESPWQEKARQSHLEKGNLGNAGTVCGGIKLDLQQGNKCFEFINQTNEGDQHVFSDVVIKRFLFPMLQGFILVTPMETPAVKNITNKITEVLDPVNMIRDYLLNFHDNIGNYQEAVQMTDAWKKAEELAASNDKLSRFLLMLKKSLLSESQLEKLKKMAGEAIQYLECFRTERFIEVDSERGLEQLGSCLTDKLHYFSGIVFDVKEGAARLNPLTTYKIRMANFLVDTGTKIRDENWNPKQRDEFSQLKYLKLGFSFLQNAVDEAIIWTLTKKQLKTAVFPQLFPQNCFSPDVFQEIMVMIVIILAWVFSAALLMKDIVYEKQQRLKEFMKIMGLNDLIHWISWFVTTFGSLILSAIFLTIFLKNQNIAPNSNYFLVFVLLVFYIVSLITQCFLISTMFKRANMAAAVGAMIYLSLYVPQPILNAVGAGAAAKIASCLLSQTALGWGFTLLSRWELEGSGAQWSNLRDSPGYPEHFSFGTVLVMLLLDTGIYSILTWYIGAVFPGEFGIPRPWYFPVTPSYWCGCGCKKTPKKQRENVNKNEMNNLEEAPDPQLFPLGVSIQNLKKVYSNGRVAVDGLSIDFYENQITSFLGHNGAGKTTTMSILTGLYPPTDGTAFIYGNNIETDFDKIRTSIGMCPQYNVLYDELTVKEQLTFYAGLKGVASKEIKKEVEESISAVDLSEKQNELAKKLSGGMKRKLSIAVAFIGGSKTVILDEPTAGVDPYARRGIWKLLTSNKAGRTIILSTHHMDEADILGDRIAMISSGQLQCCGSSIFLKRRFGTGYHLTLVKKECQEEEEGNPRIRDSKKVLVDGRKKILNFVEAHFSEVELKEEFGTEMIVRLPTSNPEELQSFFQELENNMDNLGITNYGVSDTTLEEIFFVMSGKGAGEEFKTKAYCNCCSRIKAKKKIHSVRNIENSDEKPVDTLSEDKGEILEVVNVPYPELQKKQHGKMWLVARRMQALLIKRFNNYRRSWKGAIAETILPMILVALTIGLMNIHTKEPENLPSLLLTPWLYGDSNVIFIRFGGFSLGDVNTDTIKMKNRLVHMEKGISQLGHSAQMLAKTLKIDWNSAGVKFPSTTGTVNAQLKKLLSGADYSNSIKNTLSNAMLRTAVQETGKGSPADYGIITYSHPMNWSIGQKFDVRERKTKEKKKQDFAWSLLTVFVILSAFSIIPASYVLFLIEERVTRAKHLQSVAGVSPLLYWTSNFIWDMTNFMIPCIFCMIIFSIFDAQFLVGNSASGAATFFLLFTYGLAIIPLMYPMSFIFKVPALAMVVLSIGNILIALVSSMTMHYLVPVYPVVLADPKAIFKNLAATVLLILPQYSLGKGLFYLSHVHPANQDETTPEQLSPLDFGNVGRNIIAMCFMAIVGFGFTMLLEYRFFCYKLRCIKKQKIKDAEKNTEGEDSDVIAERVRVIAGKSESSSVLCIKGLTKDYTSRFTRCCKKTHVKAVDNLSIGVHNGECFGLLGVNGAGKTTTFSILTGETTASGGDAFINGFSVSKDKDQVHQSIGYCPQFDALHALLTGKEQIMLYARLKGLEEQDVQEVVSWALTHMNLKPYASQLTQTYSGGNKRKLSATIALVGNPSVVLLDEPTAGMDPKARRFMWNRILDVVKEKRSVILTSHSMEECEVLCNRIGIMVMGKLKCFGTVQHLKQKYGEGYTLSLVLGEESDGCVERLVKFIEESFPGSVLKAHHAHLMEFCLPSERVKLSEVFGVIQQAKDTLNVEEYSLCQTTLDQVFIKLADPKETPLPTDENPEAQSS